MEFTGPIPASREARAFSSLSLPYSLPLSLSASRGSAKIDAARAGALQFTGSRQFRGELSCTTTSTNITTTCRFRRGDEPAAADGTATINRRLVRASAKCPAACAPIFVFVPRSKCYLSIRRGVINLESSKIDASDYKEICRSELDEDGRRRWI